MDSSSTLHDGVDLLLADDERRRDGVHVAAAQQAHEDAALEGLVADLRGDALGRREPLVRLLVLDVLDAGHQAHAAHVADDGVLEQGLEAVLQVRADLGAALHELLAHDDLEVGEAGGAAQRVAHVGGAAHERLARAAQEPFVHVVAGEHGAERQVAAARGPWRA